MSRTLPEVTQSHTAARSAATPFPAACPICGAATATEHNGASVIEYRRTITYACGAAYTFKPQIQNHTEKWWGTCPTERPREPVTDHAFEGDGSPDPTYCTCGRTISEHLRH